MNASYGGDCELTHSCGGLPQDMCLLSCDTVKGSFDELPNHILRNARSHIESKVFKEQILKCDECEPKISTTDVVNL